MKDAFKTFLIGYISAGHTLDDDAQNEINDLTNQFVDGIFPDYCFTSTAVKFYVEYLDENLSEETKSFVPVRFNERRYIKTLESWIKDTF